MTEQLSTPEPIHVVHIAATANGAAWMHQMLCGLRERGYRVTAIIGSGGGSLEARLTRDGIAFHALDLDPLSSRNAIEAAHKLVALAGLLRRLRPDVVHYHLFPSILLGRLAAWLVDVPVRISMIPGTYYLEAPVLGDLDLRTAPFDSKVVASCEFTRTLYRNGGVKPELLELIYYGQDAALFDPAKADGARVRGELGIAPHRPVVGDVAYFYPPVPDSPFTPRHLVNRGIKGHDVLLRAIPRVLERVPEALFVLVGEGWGPGGPAYERQLRELARELRVDHAVLFAGARSDVPEVLAAFDVSVQCSLNENLGGSIESLLMERPLVASDVGGLPDAVKHERTGLLVPPDDPRALADAITRLLLDRELATRLAQAGRQFALERLTLHRAVTELDSLYRRELAALELTSRSAGRGYRWTRTLARGAYLAPWCRRELVAPAMRAIYGAPAEPPAAPAEPLAPPVTPRPRVIQMAGAVQNADWLVSICRRLKASGHDVTAIIGWPEGSLARQLGEAGIPCSAMELSFAQGVGSARLLVYAARMPLKVLQLARGFRLLRAKIVHTHIFNSIIIGRIAAWIARVPGRVSMVPGPLHLEAPLTRAIDRLTCWMDHRVIAGCRDTYQRYEAMGLRAPQLQLVRYGVDPARFAPKLADATRVRSELGLACDAPVVGLIAYFYPPRSDWQTPPHIRGRGLKGHEDFLAAVPLVRQRFPAARFLLVGAGWGPAGERYRQKLIAEAAEAGLSEAVVFTGYRGDIPDVLAAFDVAVQCSLSENYGGTIESLLMCRPTVATRVGGMPETVRHEETGLLVPPAAPEALASAICRLLEDRPAARKMAEAGRELMLAQFGIDQTVCGIEAVYRDMLGTDAGASVVAKK